VPLPFLIPAIAAAAGAGASIFGANKAASAQTAAANAANKTQLAMFAQTQKNTKPYIKEGAKVTNQVLKPGLKPGGEFNDAFDWQGIDTKANEAYGIGSTPIAFNALDTHAGDIRNIGTNPLAFDAINSHGNDLINTSQQNVDFNPINMTQAELEATPGYQFTRNQGLKAVQNSAAARGLGSSGMAQRGAAEYATGLADQTWQNVYAQQAAERQARYTAQATDLERMMSGYERGYGLQSNERGAQFAAGQTNRETAMNALLLAYGLESGERSSQFSAASANKAAQLQAIQDRYNLMNTERTTNFNAYQTDLGNRYNRLYQQSALGSGSANATGAIGAQTAGNIGNNLVGSANATAAATMAGANAVGNAASDLGGYWFNNNLFGNRGAGGMSGANAPLY
jgi:hypothetical protein